MTTATQNKDTKAMQDTKEAKQPKPEKLRYSRYYEQDGMLRAYANRSMVLAFVCVPIALISLAFAVYVRVQPPIVIRIGQNGEASVVGHPAQSSTSLSATVGQGAGTEATDFERKAFVRMFLEKYLGFVPATVSHNWADCLNMMEGNLRQTTLADIEKKNLVGQIEDNQMRADFDLKRLEANKDTPLVFTAFGVRTIHQVREHKESIDQMVEEYHIRLAVEKRSEENPSGLLIAEYWEREINGEKKDSILQQQDGTTK